MIFPKQCRQEQWEKRKQKVVVHSSLSSHGHDMNSKRTTLAGGGRHFENKACYATELFIILGAVLSCPFFSYPSFVPTQKRYFTFMLSCQGAKRTSLCLSGSFEGTAEAQRNKGETRWKIENEHDSIKVTDSGTRPSKNLILMSLTRSD